MIDLNIPTAQEFLTQQNNQKKIWVDEAIKSICKQIEAVFNYITTATNGEHHMKVYKEIVISLDTGINDVGMNEVKEKLKLSGYNISLFDYENWINKVSQDKYENRVYDHDIFSTLTVGNGGKSFDERTYKNLNGFTRKVKSVMVLSIK